MTSHSTDNTRLQCHSNAYFGKENSEAIQSGVNDNRFGRRRLHGILCEEFYGAGDDCQETAHAAVCAMDGKAVGLKNRAGTERLAAAGLSRKASKVLKTVSLRDLVFK